MGLQLVDVDDETLILDARQWLQCLSDGNVCSLPPPRRCWLLRQAWLLGLMDLMDAMIF
jgi:hypothetical protein